MTARELALDILARSERQEEFSDQLMRDAFDRTTLGTKDRALARELIAGVFRNRTWLDWALGRSLTKGMAALSVREKMILRLGAYQLLKMDRIPNHAAVNETVQLAKRFGRKGIIGLTNAVLRDIIKKQEKGFSIDTGDAIEDLAILHSHPKWLVRRWVRQLGREATAKMMEADNRPAPVVIFANRQKTEQQDLLASLRSSGFELSLHPLFRQAIEIVNPSGLLDHELFGRGHFYFQDASAHLACQLVRPVSGEAILDLCAAPGGKACAVALEQPDLQVVALDQSFRKLAMVRQNRDRLGIARMPLACGDARDFASGRQFDAVLVDAPCSGLGVLRRRLDLRWRIQEDDIARLAGLQSAMLDNAAGLVRPGGRLVYSTCTVTPEENQQQIDDFLKQHREFRLDDAGQYLPAEAVAEGRMQTWPYLHMMDGAFAARMIKYHI